MGVINLNILDIFYGKYKEIGDHILQKRDEKDKVSGSIKLKIIEYN
jgi:hypothetical protein